jgi:hypothetical protein
LASGAASVVFALPGPLVRPGEQTAKRLEGFFLEKVFAGVKSALSSPYHQVERGEIPW